MVTVAPANGALRTSDTVPVISTGGLSKFIGFFEREIFSACNWTALNDIRVTNAVHRIALMLFFLMASFLLVLVNYAYTN
jgi:hypothetical protein